MPTVFRFVPDLRAIQLVPLNRMYWPVNLAMLFCVQFSLSGCISQQWERPPLLHKGDVKLFAPQVRGQEHSFSNKNSYAGVTKVSDVLTPKKHKIPARCRELLADAGVETMSLRSPSVSSNYSDKGTIGVGVSYDFMDLERARLKEEIAIAQCRRYHASSRLTQLLVTSPKALSRAGYLARADHFAKNRGRFRRIEQEAKDALERGDITISAAKRLLQFSQQVQSSEARSRAEAERREVVDSIQVKDVRGLDQALLIAEQDIKVLERRLRSIDALKVSVNAGYSQTSQDLAVSTNDSATSTTDSSSTYANVKVSMRLGAFTKGRHQYEHEAAQARLDGYHEKNTGLFWRANEIAIANRRALSALRQQRRQVRTALSEAKRNAVIKQDGYEQELIASSLRARIDVITLSAELGALDATIADTLRIEKKLKF